jgi:predicted DNA-binding ribbon-helix-helix protein
MVTKVGQFGNKLLGDAQWGRPHEKAKHTQNQFEKSRLQPLLTLNTPTPRQPAAAVKQSGRWPFEEKQNTRRSVKLGKRNTSISLEAVFWEEFKEIARNLHMTPSQLVAEIDARRNSGNLPSAIRVFVLMIITKIYKISKNSGSRAGCVLQAGDKGSGPGIWA